MVAKRKSEKYKRIKPSTLAKLMSEVTYEESIYNLNENGGNDAMSYQAGADGGESIAGLLGTG